MHNCSVGRESGQRIPYSDHTMGWTTEEAPFDSPLLLQNVHTSCGTRTVSYLGGGGVLSLGVNRVGLEADSNTEFKKVRGCTYIAPSAAYWRSK
jgi:hypothetical protein